MQLFSSCDSTSFDADALKEKQSFPFNTPKAKEDVSLPHLRQTINKLIIDRQATIKEDLFDLTYYYITPQYFSNMSKIDASINYNGFWIKFDNNYTFKYGKYEKVIGSGIYHYSTTSQLLIMLDDDEKIEPKMFTVKSNSEFINMMGRPIIIIRNLEGIEFVILQQFSSDNYIGRAGTKVAEAHNGMQIKMILLEEQPKSYK